MLYYYYRYHTWYYTIIQYIYTHCTIQVQVRLPPKSFTDYKLRNTSALYGKHNNKLKISICTSISVIYIISQYLLCYYIIIIRTYLYCIRKIRISSFQRVQVRVRSAHLWGVMCTLIYWGAANTRWGVTVQDFNVVYHICNILVGRP